MAWVKVPAEHHPIFRDALPGDRRVTTAPMFGGLAARVHGHIFAGLFGRSAIVRLGETDKATVLAMDGAQMFDPMGTGRTSKTSIQLPESMMDEPAELRGWFQRAFEHALSLPTKSAAKAKSAKAKTTKATRAVSTTAKRVANAAPTRAPAVREAAAKKPAGPRRALGGR